MAIDADYHRERIEALYADLAALDGKVNHSAMGRSFDYAGARKSITDQIDYHEKKLDELDGPYDESVQAI